tara:strand:- start:34 stop:183 length:150 start_codon:yes stop_codon:yes gene_type:complete
MIKINMKPTSVKFFRQKLSLDRQKILLYTFILQKERENAEQIHHSEEDE